MKSEARINNHMEPIRGLVTRQLFHALSGFGFRISFVIRPSPASPKLRSVGRSFVILLAASLFGPSLTTSAGAEPLKALLITGGCCHDYEAQKKILSEGISARANVTWTIVHEGDADSKTTKFSIYE